MNLNTLLAKICVSSTASLIVVENVNLSPLWNALITLAISIVSVLSIEGISWLRATIKKHTPKEDKKEENTEEKDEPKQ